MDVSLHLLSIHELDEVSETLKSTGYLEIYWKDDFLTWNPADYGGLQYSFFPQDDIWKPDVALKNSVVEYKQLGVSTLNVQVTASGEVYWYPYQASMPLLNNHPLFIIFDTYMYAFKSVGKKSTDL